MGVPQLFPWLAENFPQHVTRHPGRKNYPTFRVKADYLYFDGNASLHPVCQRVFGYGEHAGFPGPYLKLTYEEKLRKAFEIWVEGLVYSSNMVDADNIFIAIDGPAPLAKQSQQRERRFTSSNSWTGGFDPNSITPGTPFMFELTKYMNYAIRKLVDSIWKGKTVYFSPGNEPGEGEHKLINFIRGLPRAEREEKSHVVVGPDADLIMLTLVSRCRSVYLVREDTSKRDPKPPVLDQFVVDISAIAEALPGVLGTTQSIPQAVDDFVLLGFFLGNDFVPRIRMFHSLKEGINHLIKLIKRNSTTITKKGSIDWTGFSTLVGELARSEASLLAKQANDPANGRDPRKPPRDPRLINHTLLAHITDTPRGPDLNYPAYRLAYYEKAGVDESEVPEMCRLYLKSLDWILIYYTRGIPSWEHFYPYHYAPMMRDLQAYLAKSKSLRTDEWDRGRPSLPFEQLLTVLPPHSSALLPLEYRRSFYAGELAESYPEEIEFDYEGVPGEHMRKVIVPFADISMVRRVYAKVKPGEAYARNRLGQTSIFRYNPDAQKRYVSDYGTLRFHHVTKEVLPPKGS